MRTLSRPMFKMGGPIKEGVMHGIREPYRGGGQAALVGNPVYPQTGGREHHNVAKTIFGNVGKLFGGSRGWWSKIKPTGKFRQTPGKEISPGFIKGDFTKPGQYVPGPKKTAWEIAKSPSLAWKGIKENPWWAGGAAVYGGPAAGELGYNLAKGPGWSLVKQAADLAVPDWLYDQDKHLAEIAARKKAEEEKEEKETIVNQHIKGKNKPLTAAQQEKWANAQRTKRLDNLLDIMGYDQSRYDAVTKSLIDASKIIADRGTLNKKNINRELINPIIQATSARFDKPKQVREAVGLMMAKGEIEKDLYKWKPGTHLKNAQDMADTLGISVEEAFNRVTGAANTLGEDIEQLQILKKGTALTNADVEKRTRNWAREKKKEFKKNYTATDLKKAGLDKVYAVDIVSESITGPDDDGYYVIGTEVVEVTNGVPKRAW